MRLAEAFASKSVEEIQAALAGGALVIYSTGRPPLADHPVNRSSPLAAYVFASPAFVEGAPAFVENPVIAKHVGTPGWARATTADGQTVADFSVGPGLGEIKLASVSATPDFPLKVESIKVSLPAETVEFARTDYGHVYVTNSENPYRKLSVRG